MADAAPKSSVNSFDDILEDLQEAIKTLRFHKVPEPMIDANYIFSRLESLNGHRKRVDIVVLEIMQYKIQDYELDAISAPMQQDLQDTLPKDTANEGPAPGPGTAEDDPIVVSEEEPTCEDAVNSSSVININSSADESDVQPETDQDVIGPQVLEPERQEEVPGQEVRYSLEDADLVYVIANQIIELYLAHSNTSS